MFQKRECNSSPKKVKKRLCVLIIYGLMTAIFTNGSKKLMNLQLIALLQ
jgi:hypothetical protein